VRSAAASKIALVSAHLRKDVVIAGVITAAERLVVDVSEHVRSSLASAINNMASILGREDTVEYLLPMLLQLLRDEASEVPLGLSSVFSMHNGYIITSYFVLINQVRLSIISNLDAINGVIGVELLSQSLLPAIVDLAEDAKWRVRLAIIDHIPHLAQQLGGDFFNERLNDLCMAWLGDQVYSIRRAATDNLKTLVENFGEHWATERVVPRIELMMTHTNY
jgi:serine/threonine-protein phosphatase 2A regulatory subunit A